jgi:hypothetical protein
MGREFRFGIEWREPLAQVRGCRQSGTRPSRSCFFFGSAARTNRDGDYSITWIAARATFP